ncbi:MAG: hypothetical protein DI530_02835 [Sphingomonas sp.]|uniref:hypothetical protein n=1 Tax=Sphingomonas sp. TaxID=28214 RepID=UPI000DBC2CDF|nr:hypothetical protein [Sphingomonas sp.]PZU81411.1 MAG: hypothetical protein DI530_02835 [Sphingomonas sp.]
MTTYLHHLTVNTGHLARSPRHEVADDVVNAVRVMIETMLRDGSADLPVPGYRIIGERSGPALTLTIMGGEDPLATLAIDTRDRVGRGVWPALMSAVEKVDPDLVMPAPAAPYVATMLWPAINLEMDAAVWIGDFGRCVGWAWLEGRP